MKKSLLKISLYAVIMLFFSVSASALSIQNDKVFDGKRWWYRWLGDAAGMDYTEQLDFIAGLNAEAYGGVKSWRFAKPVEVYYLLDRYIDLRPFGVMTSDIFSKYFGPTEVMPTVDPSMVHWYEALEIFFGRAEFMQEGIAGIEFTQLVEEIASRRWGFDEVTRNVLLTESYKADNLGAWIVAAVPEPGIIFLFSSGLIGLAVFKRKIAMR